MDTHGDIGSINNVKQLSFPPNYKNELNLDIVTENRISMNGQSDPKKQNKKNTFSQIEWEIYSNGFFFIFEKRASVYVCVRHSGHDNRLHAMQIAKWSAWQNLVNHFNGLMDTVRARALYASP